jgi:hypothetical protein
MGDGDGSSGEGAFRDALAQDGKGARENAFLVAEIGGGKGGAGLGRAFQRRTASDGAAGADALLDFVGRL